MDLGVRNREKEKERREMNRPASLVYLFLLNMSPKRMYEGTVPYKVKLRRRAANKVARRSRRANRG